MEDENWYNNPAVSLKRYITPMAFGTVLFTSWGILFTLLGLTVSKLFFIGTLIMAIILLAGIQIYHENKKKKILLNQVLREMRYNKNNTHLSEGGDDDNI